MSNNILEKNKVELRVLQNSLSTVAGVMGKMKAVAKITALEKKIKNAESRTAGSSSASSASSSLSSVVNAAKAAANQERTARETAAQKLITNAAAQAVAATTSIKQEINKLIKNITNSSNNKSVKIKKIQTFARSKKNKLNKNDIALLMSFLANIDAIDNQPSVVVAAQEAAAQKALANTAAQESAAQERAAQKALANTAQAVAAQAVAAQAVAAQAAATPVAAARKAPANATKNAELNPEEKTKKKELAESVIASVALKKLKPIPESVVVNNSSVKGSTTIFGKTNPVLQKALEEGLKKVRGNVENNENNENDGFSNVGRNNKYNANMRNKNSQIQKLRAEIQSMKQQNPVQKASSSSSSSNSPINITQLTDEQIHEILDSRRKCTSFLTTLIKHKIEKYNEDFPPQKTSPFGAKFSSKTVNQATKLKLIIDLDAEIPLLLSGKNKGRKAYIIPS